MKYVNESAKLGFYIGIGLMQAGGANSLLKLVTESK